VLSVYIGSVSAADESILSVGFCDYIADDCHQIRNRRIYPAITGEFLQRRRSVADHELLSSAHNGRSSNHDELPKTTHKRRSRNFI
jgi:hypothetical protein